MKIRRAQFGCLAVLATVAFALLFAACGGGGGGGGPPPLSITTSSLQDAVGGKAYSALLAASGGTPPYSWKSGAAGSTALPPGLTLSSSGLIGGTPDCPVDTSRYDFMAIVNDSAPSHDGLPSGWQCWGVVRSTGRGFGRTTAVEMESGFWLLPIAPRNGANNY